jgi:hypothetical protein
MLSSSGGHREAEVKIGASERIAKPMPRLRRATSSSEVSTTQTESQQLQLQPVEPSPRSGQDPDKFFRAIVELELSRGLWVHPESPTLH